MYGYHWEKTGVGHYWDLKGQKKVYARRHGWVNFKKIACKTDCNCEFVKPCYTKWSLKNCYLYTLPPGAYLLQAHLRERGKCI